MLNQASEITTVLQELLFRVKVQLKKFQFKMLNNIIGAKD